MIVEVTAKWYTLAVRFIYEIIKKLVIKRTSRWLVR